MLCFLAVAELHPLDAHATVASISALRSCTALSSDSSQCARGCSEVEARGLFGHAAWEGHKAVLEQLERLRGQERLFGLGVREAVA